MQKIQQYTIFGKHVGYVIVTNIATVVLGIIQIPILTKALGSSKYGTWSLVITAISLITPFTMISLNSSLIRFLAAEKDIDKIKEDFLSACSLVLLLGVIFSSILLLLSGFIATSILKDASLSIYLRLSSVLILLNSIFPVLLAFFRIGTKVGIYNLLNLGLSALQVGLMILFISLGYELTGVIEAAIISTATFIVIGISIIFKQIGFGRPRFSNMKAYLKWGLPLTPNSAIQWIISASDRYIINFFLGVSATGIYNAACGMGSYASFTLMPIGIVLYPIISKIYDEGNRDECREYFKYSFKYLMMFTIPAAVGLSSLAKPLLRIITTPEFITGSSVVLLTAFGALFSCIYQISIYVIYLVGKTQITVRLLSVGAVLNIILNIILVPRMGIIGAGIGSLIAYIFLGGFSLVVARRYLQFDLSLPFLIKSAVSSVFMALCIWLINPRSVLMVFASIIAGIIIYFGSLILIKGFSKIELGFFAGFIRNIFKGILRAKN